MKMKKKRQLITIQFAKHRQNDVQDDGVRGAKYL